ncbi:MAG: hypothetical protein ACHQM6_02815 [Candidatus Kapaibacterium sp.]
MMKHLKIFLLALALSGCASWGENLGNGVTSSLQSHADSIAYKLGYGLISGIRDSLTSKMSQEKLAALIDTLLHHAGIQSSKEFAMLLDTLAGETTNDKIKMLLQTARHGLDSIRDDALGKKTSSLLANIIQNDLLGKNTQNRLQSIINDGVLGPETQKRLGQILAGVRDTLIGISTQSSIDSVVARSLARVQGTANQQQNFLTKNISTILWTLGAVLACLLILAAILFVRKKKAETMLKTVTQQIDKIPVAANYDELTKRISASSAAAGVDKDLRVFLAKNIPAKK